MARSRFPLSAAPTELFNVVAASFLLRKLSELHFGGSALECFDYKLLVACSALSRGLANSERRSTQHAHP